MPTPPLDTLAETWTAEQTNSFLNQLRNQRTTFNKDKLAKLKRDFDSLDWPEQLDFLTFVANYISENAE